MTTSLGDLILELKLDPTVFNQQLDHVRVQALKVGGDIEKILGKPLVASVDDKALTNLNKHLDLKQKHWTETVKTFNTPVTPKVDLKELEAANLKIAQHHKLQAGVKSHSGNQSKVLVELDETVVKRAITTGFNEAHIAEEVAKGIKDGNKTSVVGGLAKTAAMIPETLLKSALSGAGMQIGTSLTQDGIKKLEQRRGSTISSIVVEDGKKILRRGREFVEDVDPKTAASENVKRVGRSAVKVGKDLLGDIPLEVVELRSRKLAIAVERLISDFEKQKDIGTQLANVRRTVKAVQKFSDVPIDAISRRRDRILTEQHDQIRTRAAEILPTLGEVDKEAKHVVIASGGFAGMQGKSSSVTAERLGILFGKQAKVDYVENKDTDTDMSAREGAVWFKSIADRFIKHNITQGYNKDSVEMAARALAYRQKGVDLPIDFIGHSAGGFVAKEAVELTRGMGMKRVKGVGVGTPLFGLTGGNVRRDDYRSFMGSEDPLAFIHKLGFMGKNQTNLEGVGKGHKLQEYFANEYFQSELTRFLGHTDATTGPKDVGTYRVERYDAPNEVSKDRGMFNLGNILDKIKKDKGNLGRKMQEAQDEILSNLTQHDQAIKTATEGIDPTATVKSPPKPKRKTTKSPTPSAPVEPIPDPWEPTTGQPVPSDHPTEPAAGKKAKKTTKSPTPSVPDQGKKTVEAGVDLIGSFPVEVVELRSRKLAIATERLVRDFESQKGILTQVSNLERVVKALQNFSDVPMAAISKRRDRILTEQHEQIRTRAAEILPTLGEVDEEAKHIVIASGGFAGAEGKSSVGTAERFKRLFGKQAQVDHVENKDTDTDAPASKPAAWVAQIGQRFIKHNITQGYNKDAVEMAARALAYRQKGVDLPIDFMGYSAGGFVAKEAVELTRGMGMKKVKGVGIATPLLGLTGNVRRDDFRAFIGTEDPLSSNQVLGFSSPHQRTLKGVGKGHFLQEYLGDQKFQAELTQFLGHTDATTGPKGAAAYNIDEAPKAIPVASSTIAKILDKINQDKSVFGQRMKDSLTDIMAKLTDHDQAVQTATAGLEPIVVDTPAPRPKPTTTIQTQPNPPPVVPTLDKSYQKLIGNIAKLTPEGKIHPTRIPELKADASLPATLSAAYLNQENQIALPPEKLQAIAKVLPQAVQNLTETQLKDLNVQLSSVAHEAFHAGQYGFSGMSQKELVQTGKVYAPTLPVSDAERSTFSNLKGNSIEAFVGGSVDVAKKGDPYKGLAGDAQKQFLQTKVELEQGAYHFQAKFLHAFEQEIKSLAGNSDRTVAEVFDSVIDRIVADVQKAVQQVETIKPEPVYVELPESSKAATAAIAKLKGYNAELTREIARLTDRANLRGTKADILQDIITNVAPTDLIAALEAIEPLIETGQRGGLKLKKIQPQPEEAAILERIKESDIALTKLAQQLQTATGKEREALIVELSDQTLQSVNWANDLRGKVLSSSTRMRVGQFKGRVENDFRSNLGEIHEARARQLQNHPQVIQPITSNDGAEFESEVIVAKTGLQRIHQAMRDATYRGSVAIAKVMEVEPTENIKGNLHRAISSPKAKDLATEMGVGLTAFATSTAGSHFGPVAGLGADLVGGVVARQAIMASTEIYKAYEQSTTKDFREIARTAIAGMQKQTYQKRLGTGLTGDVSGWAIGNATAVGVKALTASVPALQPLAALPWGAPVAMATVPKVVAAREKFQSPPPEFEAEVAMAHRPDLFQQGIQQIRHGVNWGVNQLPHEVRGDVHNAISSGAAKVQEMGESTKNFFGNVNGGFATIKKAGPGVNEFLSNMNVGFAKLKEVGAGAGAFLGHFADKLRASVPGADLLIGGLKNLVVGFVGFQLVMMGQQFLTNFIGQAIEATRVLGNLKTAMEFASGSSLKASIDLGYVDKTVDDLKIPLASARDGFKNLAASTHNTSVEGAATKTVFTGIAEASTVLGLTADQQSGALDALSKMASKGTIDLGGLRDELGTRIPGAMNIAARAMGVTSGELEKLITSGQVRAEDFLPKFGRQLQAEFGGGAKEASTNAQSAQYDFQNANLRAQEKFGELIQPAVIAFFNTMTGAIKLAGVAIDSLGILMSGFGAGILAEVIVYISKTGIVLRLLGLEGTGVGGAWGLLGSIAKRVFGAIPGLIASIPGLLAAITTKLLALVKFLAPMLLEMTLVNGAMETFRNLFDTFTPDDATKKIQAFTQQGIDGLTKMAEAADAAAGKIAKITNKPTELKSQGYDLTFGIGGMFGKELKTDDVIKGARSVIGQGGNLIGQGGNLIGQGLQAGARMIPGVGGFLADGNLVSKGLQGLQAGARMIPGAGGFLDGVGGFLGGVGGFASNLIPKEISTMAEMKFNDQKIAYADMAKQGQTIAGTVLGGRMAKTVDGVVVDSGNSIAEQIAKVKAIDDQIKALDLEKQKLELEPAPNKLTLEKITKEKQELTQARDLQASPIIEQSAQINEQIKNMKKALEDIDAQGFPADKAKEMKDQITPTLDALEKAQQKQEVWNRKLSEAAIIAAQFGEQWQKALDKMEDSSKAVDRLTVSQKAALAQNAANEYKATGRLNKGQQDFASVNIDNSAIDAKLKTTTATIERLKKLMDAINATETLKASGISEDAGLAELKSKNTAATDPRVKQAIDAKTKLMEVQDQQAQLQLQMSEASVAMAQRLHDVKKQIEDFYRGIERQAKESALDVQLTANELKALDTKNRIRGALRGLQDNYISQFVDGLVDLINQGQEPFKIAIENQKSQLSKIQQLEDTLRSAKDLSETTPTGEVGGGDGTPGRIAGGTPGSIAGSVAPTFAGKVVMERTGKKDEYGLENLKLVVFDKSGKAIAEHTVNSGQSYTQDKFGGAGTTRAGSLAPVEYGTYNIAAPTPSGLPGVGKTFIGVNPTFNTQRGDIGFHTDANRATSPGSAGCIVFKTEADFDKFQAELKASGASQFQFLEGNKLTQQLKQSGGSGGKSGFQSLPSGSGGAMDKSAIDRLFVGGTNAPIAKIIGMAEGNRTASGGYTKSASGHIDPGNSAYNIGSFSAQGDLNKGSIAASDEAVINNLIKPSVEKLYRKAKQEGVSVTPKLLLNYLDTINQGGEAVGTGWSDRKSTGVGFLGKLSMVKGKENDEAAIRELRMESYRNTRGSMEVAGIFQNRSNFSADQQRRMSELNKAASTFGLSSASARPPVGVMMPTTGATQADVESSEKYSQEYKDLQAKIGSGEALANETTKKAIEVADRLTGAKQTEARNLLARNQKKLQNQLKQAGRDQESQTETITREFEDKEAELGPQTNLKAYKKQLVDAKRYFTDASLKQTKHEESTDAALADGEGILPALEEAVKAGQIPQELLDDLKGQVKSLQDQKQTNLANRAKINALAKKQIDDINEKYGHDEQQRQLAIQQEFESRGVETQRSQAKALEAQAQTPGMGLKRFDVQQQALQINYRADTDQAAIERKKFMNDQDELVRKGERTKAQAEEAKRAYDALAKTNLSTLTTQLQTQTKELEKQKENLQFEQKSRIFQSGMNLNNAYATHASSLGFETQAKEIQKRGAIAQENFNLQSGLRDIDNWAKDVGAAPDIVAQLRNNLMELNQVNLKNINNQFNPLTDAMKATKGAFQGFLSDVISGNATIGEAFSKMVDSVLSSLANMAAQMLADQLFGGLFGMGKNSGGMGGGGGLLGGLFGGGGGGGALGAAGGLGGGIGGIVGGLLGFATGGPVTENSSHQALRDRPDAIGQALRKEGSNSVLAALTPGEMVLTPPQTKRYLGMGLHHLVGQPDAAVAQANKANHQGRVYNFATGGMVPDGIATSTPTVSTTNIGGNNSVSVPVNISGGGDGAKPSVNVPKMRDAVRSAVLEELKRQQRPNGRLYQ